MIYDLVVVGGGAAGLAAAREGRRRRAHVLMISDSAPGGECTFTGCVPSKTLIAEAGRRTSFIDAMQRVRATIEEIAATEDEDVLRSEGIEVIRGRAHFLSGTKVVVEGKPIDSRRVVIATGTAAAAPRVEGLDDVRYLTNENVFDLRTLPSSMIVLGGGPIGCELAQAFSRFGTTVSVVERAARLLSSEEPEVSGTLLEVFRREGIDVRTDTTATKAERTAGGVRIHFASGEPIEAVAVLVAAGRTAVTRDLGLETAGVDLDDAGFIHTDDTLATTANGIWAAGDVTGRSPFTHAADEMGRIAASNALGRRRRRFDVRSVPFVVFTDPEVARVGCTTADLDAVAGPRIAFRLMSEVDRAVTEGRTDGFIKLIGGRRRLLGDAGGGRLVGATIVCARAGELINEAAIAIRTKMFLGRLAQTIHAYPTWSVAVRQTAAQFFGYGNGTKEGVSP